MTKGLARSLSRGSQTTQEIIKQSVAINQTISVTGASGVGYGTIDLAAVPKGTYVNLGASFDFTLSTTSTDVSATFSGDVAIGQLGDSNGTIAGTEENIVTSSAIGPATSRSLTAKIVNASSQSGAVFNNEAGTLLFKFSLNIDDADISADADFTIEGVFTFAGTLL